jgi:hypothetical protein
MPLSNLNLLTEVVSIPSSCTSSGDLQEQSSF